MKGIFTTNAFFIIGLFIFNIQAIAQENQQSSPEFPIGAVISAGNSATYGKIDSSGINYMQGNFNSFTENSSIKLIGGDINLSNAYISKYAMGYYTRWQAERNTFNNGVTGLKHPYDGSHYIKGTVEYYDSAYCWASDSSTGEVVDSLIWGPNYKQEKNYRWNEYQITPRIPYLVDYRLALTHSEQYEDTTSVCRLSIFYRYKYIVSGDTDYTSVTFADTILRISDFPDSELHTFEVEYSYPDSLSKVAPRDLPGYLYPTADTTFIDTDPGTGIEFRIDFYGNGRLYTDWIEVYDQNIWGEFVSDTTTVIDNIRQFVFNHTAWNSLEYWLAYEEPHTLDSFTPYRIVDSLLQNDPGMAKQRPLTTLFYPHWSGKQNGDKHLQKFVEMANPTKLMMDRYTFWTSKSTSEGLWWLKNSLEDADLAQPGFWYYAQAFGERLDSSSADFCYWKKPTPEELNAAIMLGLSFGSKGIMLWKFSSSRAASGEVNCNGGDTVYFDAIVKENGDATPLYYYVRDDLVPRMKGTFGNTINSLTYNREYLMLRRGVEPVAFNTDQTVYINYLTLSTSPLNPTPSEYNFHAGLFTKQSDNNFFLLSNLLPDKSRTVFMEVENPVQNFKNIRFRNIEPQYNFDTTFTNSEGSISVNYNFAAGEGYLFQVAPVIKYGGKLVTNESVANQILYDDMIIEDGVILTVNGDYTSNGNIYLKGNAKIQTSSTGDGSITFAAGKSIIMLGQGTLTGNQNHYLTITAQSDTNAVSVDSAGGLTANYCHFVNGKNAIKVYGNAGSVIVYNCTFSGQTDAGVTILGNLTALPKIKWCSFSNSATGVQALGCSSIIIQNNTFTDNDYDVKLFQVSEAQVINNEMTNTSYSGQGIFLSSTNGYLRQNQITGHINGIYLANSSPNIGANTITGNRNHGIYAGTGSQPDLRGYLVQIPCHNPPLYYALRGYNSIYSNGITGIGIDYDGSEILLSRSSLLMDQPCNEIQDDRTGLPASYVQNLISGTLSIDGTLNIPYQGWGDTTTYSLNERFGNLDVNYEPFYSSCPQIENPVDCPQIIYATDGTVIDTLYPIAEAPDTSSGSLDAKLRAADTLYLSADYAGAEAVYTDIINDYPNDNKTIKAYTQLFSIKKITDSTGTNFSELKSLLESKLTQISDSLVWKVASQLAALCLVGNSDFVPAINSFDAVAQQNPGTDEAFYAEIDAITTAIISYNRGGGLQKGLSGKYQASSEDELLGNLNQLFKNKFGDGNKKSQFVPTEYLLYNNYPNPFNPTTIIRFDIPERTQVELVVYDILGRKVISLISNEVRNPGRYEVSFSASGGSAYGGNAPRLASGIYIYKLTTNKYSQARKMLLLK